jgi:hypothetical protein
MVGGGSVSYTASWNSSGSVVTLSSVEAIGPGDYEVTVNADVAMDLFGGPSGTGALLDGEFGDPAHDGVPEGDPTDTVRWIFSCPSVVAAPQLGPEPTVERYALLPARPNPFAHSTRIEFWLPDRSPVDLAIFDPAGRRIRQLARGTFAGPSREILIWDGLDAEGHAVAPGVYFYRLQAGTFTSVRRLVVLR